VSKKRIVKAEVLRGPFDPGGQPETATGQPLEISLFGWNVAGGLSPNKAVLTDIPRYRDYWHWPTASKMLQAAERVGFDHQIQYGMWTGYGGPSQWNDAGLDFATAAAAGSAITQRISHFSTVHVGYRFHPMHIAKIGADIDFISNGRWGMNIVAGQSPEDFKKFGFKEAPPPPERYAIADEFTTLLKYLWTHDDPVDFEGTYFQAYGAHIAPKPVTKPRPVLMNAGQSEVGFDFACRQADWVFIGNVTGKVEDYSALVEKAHSLGAKHGRTVRVAAMCYCVMEDTDAKAKETIDWLASEIDREAIITFMGFAVGTSNAFPWDDDDPYLGLGREQFLRQGLGSTGFQLFGGYETVAEKIRALHEVGIENIAVCFWDPQRGIEQFGEHVFPLLRRMNLRK
jgi:dimethylsulfone monooxygenase